MRSLCTIGSSVWGTHRSELRVESSLDAPPYVRLDLGEVEDVIDERQEVLSAD
jgi:hypothetical protein